MTEVVGEARAARVEPGVVEQGRRTPLGLISLGVVVLAALAVPLAAPSHYTVLMLPFFANCIILLGLNLLFGYTGLLSFGHALFLGLGAYTTAFCTSQLGIRSMEVILLLAALISLAGAVPGGGGLGRVAE